MIDRALICCTALLMPLTACGGRQLSAGDETGDETSGAPSDLPTPDPPTCDSTPPSAVVELGSVEAPISASLGRMFWEPQSERLILFGGLRSPSTYDDAVLEIDPVSLETQILEWAPGPTFELTDVSAAKDPYSPRWWFVGGEHGSGLETEVLEVRRIDDQLVAKPLPPQPSEVVGHGVGFDPESGRLVYTLGWDGHPPDTDYREETWVLHPDAPAPEWTLLPDAGGPPGQDDADLVWVPTQGLFLLAYTDTEAPIFSGIWQLSSDSDAWISHDLATQVGHRGRARLFWDDPSCRLILWTQSYNFGSNPVPAIWILDPFSTPMTAIELPRPEPVPTYGYNAGYDPVHRVVIEHGGSNFDVSPSEYVKTMIAYGLE